MCTYDWDSADPDTVTLPIAGVCSASNIFTAAGVYTINVTGSDDNGGTHTASVMVVVFDPDAGFVTGGGTIDSPPGALVADPTAVGKANFGFVSKYPKRAAADTVPEGQTEFQFQAGNFNFHSASYEWLVVAGH
jgi:hypothetical protein